MDQPIGLLCSGQKCTALKNNNSADLHSGKNVLHGKSLIMHTVISLVTVSYVAVWHLRYLICKSILAKVRKSLGQIGDWQYSLVSRAL